MKIVAFLQNMWVRNPAAVHAGIARHGEKYRRRVIAYALFAGCLTGRRLRRELGDLCATIIWDEASREILNDPKLVPTPDQEHVRAVIAMEKPDLVLSFGRIAYQAVYCCGVPVIRSPHPAARREQDQADFRKAMAEVRKTATPESMSTDPQI